LDIILKTLKSLFIAIAFAVFVQRVFVLTMPMIEMGGMEINVLYGMLRVLQGEPLYQNAASFPFSAMQYPPLHYFIVAKAALFCTEKPDLETLYSWNRAFSLCWNVLLSMLVFWILQKAKQTKFDAVFWASVVFVAATMPFYNRMDALYWLLFLVFITINRTFLLEKSNKTLCFSAIIAALLCLTKQTAYGLIALHFLFFIQYIGLRKTVVWAALTTFCYGIGFFMMVENPVFFYQNTILGLVCKVYFWQTLLAFFTNKHFIVLLPLCAAAAFFVYLNFRLRKYYDVLLLLYTLFFAFLGIFKEASDVHYFAETTILVCLQLALFSTENCSVLGINSYKRLKIALLCFTFPLFFVKTTSVFYKIHVSHFIHNEADLLANEKAAALYLENRLNDTVFAHVFYTSTIPARLQQHIITPQPDVFSAVSDQNPSVLNANTAFSQYNQPNYCVIRNDETIQDIHNRLRIAFPKNYVQDTVFGRVEVWRSRF
jgi:hypothetical protein